MSYVYRIFVKGLLTLLPLMVTIYLLVWIVRTAESAFGEPLRSWLPAYAYFPGAGVTVMAAIVFLVGLLVSNFLTQRFIKWFEGGVQSMPFVRSIYSPVRDVTQLFATSDKGERSERVVLVSPFGNGVEMLGLLTRDDFSELPKATVPDGFVAVFIPFSYAMGGFTVVVPKTSVRETAIAADKAMQLALTAWIKTSH